ncbi:MAG: hypothetical protein RBG13Loki_2059, partial [Promethearchaeota archaeon CR_4]
MCYQGCYKGILWTIATKESEEWVVDFMTAENIVIEIIETEDATLAGEKSYVLKNNSAVGILRVINPSEKSRIWNLKLEVGEKMGTTLNKFFSKEEVEAKSTWETSYQLDKSNPIVKLAETVDANPSTGEIDPYFVYNGKEKCRITLDVTNQIKVPIQKLKLVKKIPAFLSNIEIEETSVGVANINRETKEIIWEINPLDTGSTATCKFIGKPNVGDVSEKDSEPIEITYEAENALHSQIKPQLTCLTDTMNGVDKQEGAKPGTWDCEAEMVNESTIGITLQKVVIEMPTPALVEKVVDLAPNLVIPPGKSWKHSFTLQSNTVPKLTPKFDFNTNSIVQTKIVGKQIKESTKYTVLRAEVEKIITPPTVDAYANTNLNIIINVSNEGTAPIDTVTITDEIPVDFELPQPEQLKVSLNVDGEVKPLTTENVKISLSNRTFVTEVFKLVEGTKSKMPPKAKLSIVYPLIARAPKPGTPYPTPVKISANTSPRSFPYVSAPEKVPEIGIRYVKRAIKTMKSVSPGETKGEFAVKVRISNRGDVELENIQVQETMPAGFKITSFLPKQFVPKEEGGRLTWTIPRIDANDELTLTYTVEGSGEFPRTEPEVVVDAMEAAIKKDTDATKAAEIASEAPSIAGRKSPAVNDLFLGLAKMLQSAPITNKVIGELEKFRDSLGSIGIASPILHEMGTYCRDLKKWDQNKPIVG